MTSHCYPCCKNASRVPYVGRISAGENNDIEFIYQFVNHIKYPGKWKDYYLTGTPTKFPNYGDFPRSFYMRNYGFNVSISPRPNEADFDYITQSCRFQIDKNYIDILFYEAVYPIRVSIYEIYNPGNIIRIWAQNSDSQWYLLWEGLPQIVPPTSRLFSPPLQSCDFKTKSLRLEFKSSKWDYCTKLDAIMLIGTSELIVPKNPEESLTDMLKKINCSMYFQHETEDVQNLTTDYENAQLDIIHLQENFSEYCIQKSNLRKTFSKCNLDHENVRQEVTPDYVQRFKQRYDLHRSLFKYGLNSAKRLSSDGFMEVSNCNFSKLPEEMILKVLKYLDFRALCRMSQVNKYFNNLTRDCRLYTCLNVQCTRFINPMHTYNIFDYFTPRCKYLQQLDLTTSEFSVSDFIKFLNNCGSHLTHLRLNKCICINNTVLKKISKICKNLKKLDLRYCKLIEDKGFSYLENLGRLEHLSISFYAGSRETETLCRILQKNQQMRELHLDMTNISIVATDLRSITFEDMREIYFRDDLSFHSKQDINRIISTLATCKNLRKIIFYTFGDSSRYIDLCDVEGSLNRLFSSCQYLEEVCLFHILINCNLYLLTQCKNLRKLHLYNITLDKCSVILEQCPKLQELHLIDCEINKLMLNQWRERYSHVSVFVMADNYLRYQGEGEYIDIDNI